MLCVSLQKKQDTSKIRFEIEPYYRRKNRIICSVKEISSYNTKILLRDSELKKNLGYSIALSLLIPIETDDGFKNFSVIAYPHLHGKIPVIRTDEEFYQYKKERTFCEEIILPNNDADNIPKDYMITLAEKVLTHLPISEELCHITTPLKS